MLSSPSTHTPYRPLNWPSAVPCDPNVRKNVPSLEKICTRWLLESANDVPHRVDAHATRVPELAICRTMRPELAHKRAVAAEHLDAVVGGLKYDEAIFVVHTHVYRSFEVAITGASGADCAHESRSIAHDSTNL
eukprot:gnl/Spiro4/17609_TR9387_c1_g2_i1.p2 gnl/Spiro4/17609_TR9387_c1_g2~~gnl/Spiro4/17609_TR9387_c1_g2_i1.p2  ORF type:complete len:134 (+),score=13.44 gnl/Spiro4/17609_TR9387_c1_g2_i1:50-451(+)